MNIICVFWVGLFTLCQGENSIAVEFTAEGCTSNCLEIKNPEGKVKIYGVDKRIADIAATEIIEQTFSTNEVPFTLDIVYPANPSSVIQPATDENNAQYYLDIIWDSDDNGIADCAGDISLDKNKKFPNVDLNDNNETQTLYVKQISDATPCQSDNSQNSITVKFVVDGCASNCIAISNPEGSIVIYGYDPWIADVGATKIMEQAFVAHEVPFTLDIVYPANPASLIEYLGDEKDATYWLDLHWDSDNNGFARCAGDIGTDSAKGITQEVKLTDDSETQTIYVQQLPENWKCAAAGYNVKVLLCLSLVFYLFV